MVACPARLLPEPPYGAPELKALARTYLSRALVSSSGLWLVIFCLVLAASAILIPGVRPVPVLVRSHEVLPPPPEIPRQWEVSRPHPVAPTPAKSVPIPVPTVTPDAPLDPVDPGPATLPAVGSGPSGPTPAPEGSSPVEDPLPSPDAVTVVDEIPVAITIVKPEYPSLPRDAGVEGTVVVRALVGRDGHVLEAFIEPKTSIPMLDGAALEAARAWVFKPALTANHTVAAWVAIRMRFTLH